ncbi:MAG: DUF6273 domain-containing protein [Clostridiales bacterium]|jgi:hypothetical protein|nr:DUF6273 domain-containing protein [Clostridiales bacterium]
MECRSCHSKWEPSRSVSKALTECPFCGASLADADDNRPVVFDNSKDALAYIASKHGEDVLLGETLKNFYTDYAPSTALLRKNVIFTVSVSGAAAILKNHIGVRNSEKEAAYKQAVQKVIDTYGIERPLVESVIREFIDALGWKIKTQIVQAQQTPATVRQNQQTPTAAPVPVQQKRQIPEQPVQWRPLTLQPKPVQPIVGSLTVGQRNVTFGKYAWRVLDAQNSMALLITEDIIEKRPYNKQDKKITWEESTLRQYLNGEFLQTFSSAEQNQIIQVSNKNEDNQWFGTDGGNNTKDKVFLLSLAEAVKYFGDSGQLKDRPKEDSWQIDDQFNNGRMAKHGNNSPRCWLRSPGRDSYDAACVHSDGVLDLYGRIVDYEEGGVRPALWLNLQSKIFYSVSQQAKYTINGKGRSYGV